MSRIKKIEGPVQDNITIRTDHKWKNFLYGYELTKKEKANFDWMDKDDLESSPFIRYRRCVYSLSDFMRIKKGSSFPSNWEGYHSDSFFSGVLIEISDDCSMYRIGTYY